MVLMGCNLLHLLCKNLSGVQKAAAHTNEEINVCAASSRPGPAANILHATDAFVLLLLLFKSPLCYFFR